MRMSDWSADVCSSDLATWEGVTRYLRRPVAMTRYVTEASEMMRERATTHVEAVQRVMDAEAGRLKAGHAAMLRWGYFLLGQIQRTRSEEHTSELQSLMRTSYADICLKKKKETR